MKGWLDFNLLILLKKPMCTAVYKQIDVYLKMMKKIFLWVGLSCIMAVNAQAQITETLQWHTLPEAIALNKTQPKKFLVDIYTDWCGWCKVMDKNTFQHQKIAAIIDKYFYAVKFNAEKDGEVDYKGKVYKLENGYHQLTSVLMNNQASGYPTICYMDEEMNIIQAISGYQTPEQIEPVLQFFGSNSYKNTDWQTYTSTFKTTLK
jgi:thioredoxin-related protein